MLSNTYEIKDINISVEEIYNHNRLDPKFTDEFRLLKTISKHQMIFRYRFTGRVGYIKVLLKNNENNLYMIVYQATLGFVVPIIAAFSSIVFFLLHEPKASMYLFAFGLFWLFLIYFYFHIDSKKIEKSLRRFVQKVKE